MAAAGGVVRFDRYMDIALYGPHGFYMTSGRAGRRGDFITSPEVGPLFGEVMGRWLDAEWQRLGCPDPFRVIDLGAGPGTLARSILASRAACVDAIDYVAVEISASQRERHPTSVHSSDTLPDDCLDGVVIANELLDNLPFRLLVFDGSWREAHVTRQGDRLVEVLAPIREDVPVALPSPVPHGARLPLHQAGAALLNRARQCIGGGRLMVIDYGAARTAALALRPWRDWLRTYRGHERGRHYLLDPGLQDITTDVAFDQVAATLGAPDEVRTQAQWLQRWGVDDLVDDGRRIWQERAARPDLEAVRMRSRITEAEALLDPTGLGAFVVAEWRLDTPGAASDPTRPSI